MPADAPRRYQGQIVEWNDEKRCGFVRPRGTTNPDHVVFLPARSLTNRTRTPKVGDTVLYETIMLDDLPKNRHLRTRLRAENASFLGEDPPTRIQGASEQSMTVFAALHLAVLAAASPFSTAALGLLFADLCLSLLAIVLYACDKSAAKNGRRRTPEGQLHLLALLGGWPGAAVAQRLLRHKTRKPEFQGTFKTTAAINAVATLGYLFVAHR